jgi:glutamine amidotransferase
MSSSTDDRADRPADPRSRPTAKAKLVIVDYDASNLHSVRKALVALGHRPIISNDPAEVAAADALVLPGVGAAGDAMRHLNELRLVPVLRRFAEENRPFFGVCVGLQLLFESSDEDGGIECLGLLKGHVRRLPAGVTVPHMGWNSVSLRRQHPAFAGLPGDSYFYFVHSYYPVPEQDGVILGETEHGAAFASVVAKDNLLGVQFHPEKSGRLGLRLYDNFVRLSAVEAEGRPTCRPCQLSEATNSRQPIADSGR